jgi:hypothetical protein
MLVWSPLKARARAHGVATQKPARATTSIEQSSNPSVMRVLLVPPRDDDQEIWPKPAPPDDDPEIWPKPAPPNDDPEIWPKPDGFEQRFTGRQR